jgi:hypothetical protein
MKMKTLLMTLMLLLPGVSWAADGDPLNGAAVTRGSYESAPFIFCDAKAAASDDVCDEFDLQATGRGMPDYMIFSLDSVAGCDAGYQVIIQGATTTAGTDHTWGTLDVTNTSLVITTPTHRFFSGDTTDAGCTDLTVNLVLHFRKD